jgi:His/Glu/Gln/Arg/opine family amino acid ABC transporter permease subunit
MPDLGIDVLFKGTNMLRLLQGLWVAMKISIVSILISMPLGILVGALMTVKNKVVKAFFRVYLEFIRIMPQLVVLIIRVIRLIDNGISRRTVWGMMMYRYVCILLSPSASLLSY